MPSKDPRDPGPLRQRVTLQTAAEAPDPRGGGQVIATWNTVGTYWARVETLTGREQFYASQVVAMASHKVRVRQVAAITPKDRVLFGTLVLNISAVIPVDQRTEWYDLLCTEQATP